MSVYFVRMGTDGPVKIGFAHNVRSRIKGIQCHCPHELILLRNIKGADYREEYKLHHHFKSLRIRGEWFHFAASMLKIDPSKLKDPNPPPPPRPEKVKEPSTSLGIPVTPKKDLYGIHSLPVGHDKFISVPKGKSRSNVMRAISANANRNGKKMVCRSEKDGIRIWRKR